MEEVSLLRRTLADVPLYVYPVAELFYNKVLFRKLVSSPYRLHCVVNRIPIALRLALEKQLKYVLRSNIDWEEGIVLRIKDPSLTEERPHATAFHLWKNFSTMDTAGCLITAVELCCDRRPAGWRKMVGSEGSGICYSYADRVVLYAYISRGSSIERSYVVHFRK